MTTADPVDTANLLLDFETIYGADLIGATIMRVRGMVDVSMQQTNGGAGVNGVFGLQVADGSSFVGAPAQLGPIAADRYGQWFAYYPFVFAAANVTVPRSDSHIRFDVDVRAKRRIDELRQMLLLGVEMDTMLSQAQVGYGYNLSILVALA